MKKTILIVDDSRSARQLIKLKLAEAGYEVLEASSGAEALSIVKSQAVDLVTVDLEMPGKNGYEVCQEIRVVEQALKRKSAVPLIILTGHDSFEGRQKGFASGATNFIIKNVSGNELVLRIRALIEPETKFSQLGVLVVDDSDSVKAIVVEILQEMNVSVFTAGNGQEGIQVFKENIKKIDMILTDLDMPVMNGEELCQKIRTELSYKTLPIIVITGNDDQSKCIDLFRAGATEFMRKPFLKEELVARVAVHLEKCLLERAAQAAINDLREADAIKDKFLAICSHDLRNPVNGILGCADLMLDESPSDSQKNFLEGIKTSAGDLLALVEDLLELSKMKVNAGPLRMERVQLSEVLSNVLNQQQSIAAKKEISLVKRLDDTGAYINGNPGSIKRIANNLLSNAVKFTPRKGEISVDLIVREKMVELEVRDTGVGIPKENLSKIFSALSSGAGKVGTEGEASNGLGLSIVKELVEQNGGQIGVESEVGKGTKFRLSFSRID